MSLLAVMVIATGIPATLYAQKYEGTPVTVSKEKLKVNGQVCYSHIVLEKQTLFSICQAYNVTIEDIYQYNPSVKEKGLQKNSILIIPVVSQGKATERPEEKPEEKEAVAVEEAIEYDVREEVPETERNEQQTQQAELEYAPRRIHTVKWYEDLNVIAEKYGVTVEAIMQANGLKGRKLAKRQKLIIPMPGEIITAPEIKADTTAVQVDSLAASDTSKKNRFDFSQIFAPKKKTHLSLMLPFKADGSTGNAGNMDFYSGVLLAIYEFREKGYDTELKVFDVAEGKIPASKESIEDSDMIIGPISPKDIRKVFDTAPETKAVVSPLDQKAADLVASYKNMIQGPTPLNTQYKDLVSWIKEDMEYSDRALVISEKGAKQTDAVIGMKAAIDSSGLEYKHLEYSILEGRNVTGSLEYLMTESGTNRVYIASDSEAFVNDVVRNLNLMIHKKYDVVLYAPSRIRNYETIEVENFHNTSLHISTGYYIDYNDPRVQEFLLKYRALFNTEPTQFSFQGYDLANYFIGLHTKYGQNWYEHLEDSDTSLLQSTFCFRKDNNGGLVNTGVRRIVYGEGWSIERVR